MTDDMKAKLNGLKTVTLSDSHIQFGDTHISKHSLPLLVVNSATCDAIISLQGAQVLSFQPKEGSPWLWLSPYASFEAGKSIRGGIPVCLPWFGVNRENANKPKHGFVRQVLWQLDEISEVDGLVEIILTYHYSGNQPELFASAFDAQLTIRLSTSLELTLSIHNRSAQPVEFSWAFHTYYAVADLANTSVAGLDQQLYLDNTQHLRVRRQIGDVRFLDEVDSVYQSTASTQHINNESGLTISGNNCPTCIIWNPGQQLAHTMSDVKDGYNAFICIERGCAFNDTIQLGVGQLFSGTMVISSAHH